MSILRKTWNLVDNLFTSTHHKWWNFLNWYQKYQVKPFSARYWWTRQKIVGEICERTLAASEYWDAYIHQPHLRFYDERIVEYSWAINKISKLEQKTRFLDIGCVMNTKYCLEKLLKQFTDIHFLNLVSEPLAMHGRISFHTQDIRECDLPKHSFDCITCISTLEHVGGDNSYNDFSINGTSEIEAPNQYREPCWQEGFISLMELLAPDGLLLVSMPYGGGLWKNGEYKLGEQDIEDFHEIASRYKRKVITTIMQKDKNGWHKINDSKHINATTNLQPAGANMVTLVETVAAGIES